MNKILSYIYDFLSMIFEEESLKDEIKEIILFGSIAKKSFDKKSDIDLFFNIKNKEKISIIESSIKNILKSFEIKAEKTWKIKKIGFPISFIVGSLEDETWSGIKEEIASSGIILYGAYKKMPEKIRHFYLFYYSLNKLQRKEKMRFIRSIFGYAQKKNKKEYQQRGLIESINGIKVASNVVITPSDESKKLKELFNKHKIEYKILEIWVRI